MKLHLKDLIRPIVGRRVGLDDVFGMMVDFLGVVSLLAVLMIGAIFVAFIIVWIGA